MFCLYILRFRQMHVAILPHVRTLELDACLVIEVVLAMSVLNPADPTDNTVDRVALACTAQWLSTVARYC